MKFNYPIKNLFYIVTFGLLSSYWLLHLFLHLADFSFFEICLNLTTNIGIVTFCYLYFKSKNDKFILYMAYFALSLGLFWLAYNFTYRSYYSSDFIFVYSIFSDMFHILFGYMWINTYEKNKI